MKSPMQRFAFVLFGMLFLTGTCAAHVGSPDVYFQGSAGPYKLVVTVRTPPMIPGVANVEVIGETPGISRVQVVPLYIAGRGSKYSPAPDALAQSKSNPQYFSGSVWLMDAGSWQVRVLADGAHGSGEIAVPVAAFARMTLPMQRSLGALLFGLMILLGSAVVSIAGAAAREGTLEPGKAAGTAKNRRGRTAMVVTAAVVLAIVAYGRHWWNSEGSTAARKIYAPPPLAVSLEPGGKLLIHIGDSKWHDLRPNTVMTQLMPDHGYLMHFFLIRLPQMDRFYHLHPQPAASDTFTLQLPAVPAGHYQIFADIVRESGFPDTMVAQIDLPDIPGIPLMGDNSTAAAQPFSSGVATAQARSAAGSSVSILPDGYRMVWEKGAAPLVANQLVLLRFHLEDPQGKPAMGVEPYMGMAGHAEIVRSDQSVFAHIHPSGSISMAALELAEKNSGISSASGGSSSTNGVPAGSQMPQMPGMDMNSASPDVDFPYGFPKSGEYRMFIQMRRAGHVETGVFDAGVR